MDDFEDIAFRMLAMGVLPNERLAFSTQAVLRDQEERLNQLDYEITRLEQQIYGLRAQKATLERSYDVNRALLAPVRRLPPEIFTEIFLQYTAGCSSLGSENSPILLTRICSRWRRIAMSSARLWTTCRGSYEQLCDAIPFWLSNSGSLPIDVEILPKDHCSLTLSRIIMENFGRFHSFIGSFLSLDEVLSQTALPIEAPFLESLTIVSSFDNDSSPLPKACINTPRLTELSIQTASLADLISFPTHRLHTLNLDLVGSLAGQTPSQALNFLSTFSNIHNLRIEFSGEIPFEHTTHSVVLPRLETLILDHSPDYDPESDPYDPSSFLDSIQVPTLRKLAIGHHGEGLDLEELLKCATMTLFGEDPPLQELLVDGFDSTFELSVLIPIFRKLRNLRLLIITYWTIDMDESILDYILHPSLLPTADSSMCPKLYRVDLRILDHPTDCGLREFFQMLKGHPGLPASRSSNHAYLRDIKAKLPSYGRAQNRFSCNSITSFPYHGLGEIEVFLLSYT